MQDDRLETKALKEPRDSFTRSIVSAMNNKNLAGALRSCMWFDAVLVRRHSEFNFFLKVPDGLTQEHERPDFPFAYILDRFSAVVVLTPAAKR